MKVLVRSFVCCVLATAARAQQVVVVYPPPAQPSTVVMIERERPAPIPAELQDAYGWAPQITYMIALKDNDIRVADQYWVKNETLYYLTADHQERTVPVDSVDLGLTIRLNSERNVAFYLPADQERAVERSGVVRHSANIVHKRCYCTVTRSTRASSPATNGANRAAPATRAMTR
jgi:hypothetical protein